LPCKRELSKLALNKAESMGRVFTVNVPYKGKKRAALVSFETESYDTSFLVRYLDEDIHMLVPGRRIVVSLRKG
jgi:hypothetical protein